MDARDAMLVGNGRGEVSAGRRALEHFALIVRARHDRLRRQSDAALAVE